MISIDVSNSQVKILNITKRNNSVLINSKSIINIEEPLFDSEQKLDQKLLEQLLQSTLSADSTKEVYITYSCMPQISNEYVLMYDKNPKRMLEIVKSKVFTTLSPDEYIMDYRILDVFIQDNVQQCSVVTYVVPLETIKQTFSAITNLGKKPVSFAISQNSIYNFIKSYIKKERCIMVNNNTKTLSLHLFNAPSNIITRTTPVVETSPSISLGGLDILGDLTTSNDTNTEFSQIIDLVSKLTQYQTVKYPDMPVNSIYLFGDNITKSLKDALQQVNDVPVTIINDESIEDITWNSSEGNKNINSFIYCIGNVL